MAGGIYRGLLRFPELQISDVHNENVCIRGKEFPTRRRITASFGKKVGL